MGLVSKIMQLARISEAAEEWLASHIEKRSFRKNEEVLSEGKTCNHLYYIQSGMLGGYYLRDDKQVCNWISVENDFATSYYSFISRKPSYETILSMEDTTVQCISFTKLEELYKLFPETERAGRRILEEYYLRLEERVISIQFKSAKERYDHLSNSRPEVVRRAPLGRIASYLGMTQETLSRVRTEK